MKQLSRWACRQVRFEIDVQPFASGGTGVLGRDRDEPRAHATAPDLRRNHGVEDERVHTPVPRDVDEPDKIPVITSADPPKAVALHPSPPITTTTKAGVMIS